MRKVAGAGVVMALALVAGGCFKAYDFDNDNRADFVVVLSNGAWRSLTAPPADPPLYVGGSNDLTVPGDYDGDGRFDPATLTSTGDWITQSAGTINFPKPAQLPGYTHPSLQMIPVPADYDGDHKTDPAWYRDSDGTWFIHGQPTVQFGTGPTALAYGPGVKSNDLQDQDSPVPADYDGDGKADLATYNPRTRVWKVQSSRTGTVTSVTMGGGNATLAFPAPGDYDGAHHAQRALYSSDEGWRIDGHAAVDPFGQEAPAAGYVPAYPAIADFDGDGKIDLSYVSGAGVWNTRSSAAPSTITSYSIGALNSSNASRAVSLTASNDVSVARFTLVAKNCSPTNPFYATDC